MMSKILRWLYGRTEMGSDELEGLTTDAPVADMFREMLGKAQRDPDRKPVSVTESYRNPGTGRYETWTISIGLADPPSA
jgi:hypothetical protein